MVRDRVRVNFSFGHWLSGKRRMLEPRVKVKFKIGVMVKVSA